MPTMRSAIHSLTTRFRGANLARWFAVARVMGLALLFLLPLQMRAGTDDPHPHAMLHLLLDARDGFIDHHDEAHHGPEPDAGLGAHDGETAPAAHKPDTPTVAASHAAGGAMAMLAALVVMLLVPAARRDTLWPTTAPWLAWLPDLEPPPPRVAGI